MITKNMIIGIMVFLTCYLYLLNNGKYEIVVAQKYLGGGTPQNDDVYLLDTQTGRTWKKSNTYEWFEMTTNRK